MAATTRIKRPDGTTFSLTTENYITGTYIFLQQGGAYSQGGSHALAHELHKKWRKKAAAVGDTFLEEESTPMSMIETQVADFISAPERREYFDEKQLKWADKHKSDGTGNGIPGIQDQDQVRQRSGRSQK